MSEEHFRHQLENNFIFSFPVGVSDKNEMANMFAMMNSMAIVTFLKVLFIGMVVANSLTYNLIKSQEYEAAMLRCLGWNYSYICTSIIIK